MRVVSPKSLFGGNFINLQKFNDYSNFKLQRALMQLFTL